jgi:tetratricopeptide (TPR) repeat protein
VLLLPAELIWHRGTVAMGETRDIDALCEQARVCLRESRLDEATRLFGEVLAIDDEHAEAREGLAAACFHAKDYPGAIEHFERLADLRPLDARPLINIGAVYNRQKEFNKAVAVLRKGVGKDARSSEAFYNLGIAYRNLGQHSMATTAYSEALRLKPDMSEAHVNLANVYVEMSNNRKALEHYHEALKLKPGMKRAESGLQRAEEAIEVAKAEISPFGRLVESHDGDRGSVTTGAGRVLSSVEREKDRATIREMAIEIHESAEEVTVQLRGELTDAILELGRSIAEGADRASNIVENQDHFESSLGRSQVLRKRFRDALQALGDHEESMIVKGTGDDEAD